MLLYGLEACPISNKQFNSLDFVLKGSFRKIFRTRSAEVVQNCMLIFICMSMQECIAKRKCKFLANYVKSDNVLLTIKRCSKGSIPIVKRFLGENFVRSKMVPQMALIRGNGGLDVRFYVRNLEKAHHWAERRVLAYFASKSVQGPWL